jgi:hypothetical protein
MTYLSLSRDRPVKNFAVNDESAPDAAAECDVKHRIEANSSPMPRFAERCHIRVVIDEDRSGYELANPAGQIELRPAFNLMRAANLSSFPIHRPAVSDADGLWFAASQHFRQSLFDLLSNPLGPRAGFNRQFLALNYFPGFIAGNKLQFQSRQKVALKFARLRQSRVTTRYYYYRK